MKLNLKRLKLYFLCRVMFLVSSMKSMMGLFSSCSPIKYVCIIYTLNIVNKNLYVVLLFLLFFKFYIHYILLYPLHIIISTTYYTFRCRKYEQPKCKNNLTYILMSLYPTTSKYIFSFPDCKHAFQFV